DTLGQVIMEAQASGVSCLVSDVGGPQTLVLDDQTGKVLKADDVDIWVQTIADSLQKEITDEQKQVCIQHMQQYNIEASFEHFINTHRNLYEQVSNANS
ncbi:MAG: glycosyltransferase, partial [Thiomicrorhabdus sp.]|nr:glycosyltransferase [Thiomicrorhabdus sp.]